MLPVLRHGALKPVDFPLPSQLRDAGCSPPFSPSPFPPPSSFSAQPVSGGSIWPSCLSPRVRPFSRCNSRSLLPGLVPISEFASGFFRAICFLTMALCQGLSMIGRYIPGNMAPYFFGGGCSLCSPDSSRVVSHRIPFDQPRTHITNPRSIKQ